MLAGIISTRNLRADVDLLDAIVLQLGEETT